MALKAVVEDLESVDEPLRGEYKETVDPKTKAKIFVLDLENYDALPATRKLKDEAAQNRIKATEAAGKLKVFEGLGDLEEVRAKLERFPELEALAEGKLDDSKINAIVETRVRSKLAPVERERDQFRQRATELEGTVQQLTAKERQRLVNGALGKAAREAKVQDSAIEDIELYGERLFEVTEDGAVVTKDNVGVTPGLSPKEWLVDMQSKRPHWWGPTGGGGALGGKGGSGGGVNPFTHENWNMTEQGRIVREDRARAERLAKAAGTTIGGKRPEPRK